MSIEWFNRQQALKNYKPTQHIRLPQQKIREYELKIQNICNNEQQYNPPTEYLIDLEGMQEQIDHDYVKYLFLRHIKNILEYITTKGFKLIDIEWNIKIILNDIINGIVDESYYENTIDIYDSISGNYFNDEPDLYSVIDQAIRLNNKKILYYLLFREDLNIADRVYEVIRE